MKRIIISIVVFAFAYMVLAHAEDPNTDVKNLTKQVDDLKKGYAIHNTALKQIIKYLNTKKQEEADDKKVEAKKNKKETKKQKRQATKVSQKKSTQKRIQVAENKATQNNVSSTQNAQKQNNTLNSQNTQAKKNQVSKKPNNPSSKPVLKKAKPTRGVETLLQEEHMIFNKNLTVETGITYTHYDRRRFTLDGFLALDSIFLGDISIDRIKSDTFTLDVTTSYGVTQHAQVSVTVPILYRHTSFLKNGINNDASVVSETSEHLAPTLGDISGGIYYQVVEEKKRRPDVVLNVQVKTPTGVKPYGIEEKTIIAGPNKFVVPERLPSGNGIWSVTGGVSLVKSLDPAIIFGSLAYTHNIKRHFSDISSRATTEPGNIKLGHAMDCSVGIAFALNGTVSLSFSFSQQLTSKDKIQFDGGSLMSVDGTNTNAIQLTTGVTAALTDHLAMVTQIGVGLTNDAPDATVSVKFPYNFGKVNNAS